LPIFELTTLCFYFDSVDLKLSTSCLCSSVLMYYVLAAGLFLTTETDEARVARVD